MGASACQPSERCDNSSRSILLTSVCRSSTSPSRRRWAATARPTRRTGLALEACDAFVFVTPRVQPQHVGRAEKRDRPSVSRVEQQGGGVCELRKRGWSASGRAPAIDCRGAAGGHGPCASNVVALYRLRETSAPSNRPRSTRSRSRQCSISSWHGAPRSAPCATRPCKPRDRAGAAVENTSDSRNAGPRAGTTAAPRPAGRKCLVRDRAAVRPARERGPALEVTPSRG